MKVLFLDIDGTITDEKRRLTTKSIEAIKKLRRSGFIVVATSANSYYVLKAINRYLDLFDYIIAESGGVVEIKDELLLLADKSLAVKALKEIKRNFKEMKEHWSNPIRLSDQVLDRPDDEYMIITLKNFLEAKKDLRVTLIDTRFSLQIIQRDVNKALAALLLLERLNINRDNTYAIGDSEADIEIFNFVAHPLALGNSDSRLKEKAELSTYKTYYEGFIELVNYLLAE